MRVETAKQRLLGAIQSEQGYHAKCRRAHLIYLSMDGDEREEAFVAVLEELAGEQVARILSEKARRLGVV